MHVIGRGVSKVAITLLGIIFSTAVCVILTSGCSGYSKNKTHANVSDASIKKGASLAKIYCKSCHLLPDPSQLNARSWEHGVLPQMGPRLGVFHDNYSSYPSSRFDPEVSKNFYPSQPLLTNQEWHNIIDYYTATAPDTLVAAAKDEDIASDLKLFQPVYPKLAEQKPFTCFVGFDSVAVKHSLLISTVNGRNILRLNANLQVLDSVKSNSPVVDIALGKNSLVACNIGVLVPNNGRYGSAHVLHVNAKEKFAYDTVAIFDSLRRPVQMTASDLNNDGKTDYLVCEYGNLFGALSWMENKGGVFERHVLRNTPGAIKAHIFDYNKDGLPDVCALFAQGDESIVLYTNKGNGKFEEKVLLRFPPSYGSTYFELADFNKDGYPDILYCCGDNADYSQVLKPYHGVYIYENDGNNNFTQNYFFHINGCFKAMARDFDNDGDLDIAAISFFADYAKRPEEGFVYLQNNSDNHFKASTLTATYSGRWLTMDAGDIDGDGKIDIILGNFSAPAMIRSKADFEKGPAYLLLKNVGIK